jgi:hypothetical protein
MAVDQARRSQLYGQLAGAVGKEAADTMFDLLPPSGSDLATTAGLAELDARMTAGFVRPRRQRSGPGEARQAAQAMVTVSSATRSSSAWTRCGLVGTGAQQPASSLRSSSPVDIVPDPDSTRIDDGPGAGCS